MPTPRDCPVCGQAFVKALKYKTCSRECGFVYRERGHQERGRPWLDSVQYPPRDSDHNPAWRGVEASYTSKHKRVRRHRGNPDRCTRCGTDDAAVHYEWANLTGDYDDIWDYTPMCKPCHRAFDQQRGLHPVGELMANAKLTADIVRQARTRHAAGEAKRALAREFGVSQRTMRDAIEGISWKHVKLSPAKGSGELLDWRLSDVPSRRTSCP